MSRLACVVLSLSIAYAWQLTLLKPTPPWCLDRLYLWAILRFGVETDYGSGGGHGSALIVWAMASESKLSSHLCTGPAMTTGHDFSRAHSSSSTHHNAYVPDCSRGAHNEEGHTGRVRQDDARCKTHSCCEGRWRGQRPLTCSAARPWSRRVSSCT